MGVVLLGQGGQQLQVDASHRALRTSPRPVDHGTLGAYRVSVVTGTLTAALAANAQVFQFKWAPAVVPTSLALITTLRTRFLPLTLFTAATLTDHTSFDAVVVRSYAAGGGGTTLTLTTNSAKMRTNMATTQAVINVSTTGALTLATTLDPHPISQSIRKGNRVNPAAATEETIQPTTDGLNIDFAVEAGEHPLTLATGEGLVIRNRTVWPAAGTGVLLIEIAWAEVTSYDNVQLG